MFRASRLWRLGAMALIVALPGAALAGQKHPGYARTVDDLRLARTLLQRANTSQVADASQDEVSLTIASIESALKEIDQEIGAGGAKPHALPRIPARMPWADRLADSLRLLERAEEECSREKDGAGTQGLQARVLGHLENAHTRLSVAVETVNFDYSARNTPTRND